jgi:hypothetical protein
MVGLPASGRPSKFALASKAAFALSFPHWGGSALADVVGEWVCPPDDVTTDRSNLLARAAVPTSFRLATQASRACFRRSGCLKQTWNERRTTGSTEHRLSGKAQYTWPSKAHDLR